MKIEPKDVKEYLSLKGKITIKVKSMGKYSVSIVKSTLQKVIKGSKKVLNSTKNAIGSGKNKVVNTAVNVKEKILSNEMVESTKASKIQNIETKRNELKEFIGSMEQDDEYRIGENNYYLKEIKKELRKLDKKKIKITKKGLGVFALSKIVLNNTRLNIKNKWSKFLEKREAEKKEREIQKAKEQLAEKFQELQMLKNNQKELLEKYPEINNEEITQTVTKIDDGKDIEITEITTKITEIKNPSKEKKNEIKKSNNFKKALAAMAIITGISIGTNSLLGNINKNDNVETIDIPDNHIETIQDVAVTEQVKQETNLTLGTYITIENGSTLYEKPELNGKSGLIGMNGYNDDTLFKINAITYIDENNVETTFNTVQKSEQAKKMIEEKHKRYLEKNSNVKVKNFHVTPCNELGIPITYNSEELDLGGWTNANNAKIETVSEGQVLENSYQAVGGRFL